MKHYLPVIASLGLFLGLALVIRADEPKEIKLTGTLTCAHCQLHEGTACQNVLQVKDGDKTINYYLVDNAVSKDCHGKVCKVAKDNVTVTGTVSESEGKKWITAAKIEGT